MKFRVSWPLGLAAALLVATGAAGVAQHRTVPYVITRDGVITEVAYGLDNLKSRLVSCKGCVKVTATQNSQSLRLLSQSINKEPITPVKWTAHQCIPNGGAGGGIVSFSMHGMTGVQIPAQDVAATDVAFFELDVTAGDTSFDGFANTSNTEKIAIKAQKMWLPSNFRVSLGDMPTTRVSKVSAVAIKLNGDLDGDGDGDYTIPDTIDLTIPVEDARSYQDWLASTDAAGQPVKKNLIIEYQNDDLVGVFSFKVPVTVEYVGYADLFLGTGATTGREVVVALRARGIVASKPGGMGGTSAG